MSSESTERRLAAQQAATRALIEAETVGDAFRHLVAEVAQALGWDLAVAWVETDAGESLQPAALWSRPGYQVLEDATRPLRFARGEGLPGRVWESGQPGWSDLARDPDQPRLTAAAGAGMLSALAFPVLVAGRVLAVLEFFSRERVEPDQALLDTMAAIGQQMGLFVRRREAEARLGEQEEQYRLIAQTSPDVIIVMDTGGRIRSVNPAVEHVFGWRPQELLGRPLTELMPPEARARHLEGLRHFLETGERRLDWRSVRLTGLRRDGSLVPLEVSYGTFVIEGERRFTGILRDISERVEQQRRLEESTAELQATVEELERQRTGAEAARAEAERSREIALVAARWSSFLAEAGRALGTTLNREETLRTLASLSVPAIADVCIIDFIREDGTMRRLEIARGEDAGQRARQFGEQLRPPPASGHGSPQVIRTGEPQLYSRVGTAELRALAGNETQLRWLRAAGIASLLIVPLVARGHTLGAITLVTAESGRHYDVGDLTTVEALAGRAALAIDNAVLYEQALSADRAKGNFLAIMSHELRTPLTAIMGYTDILEAGIAGELGERQRGYLDRVMVSARHLLQLIDEILTFSRLEVGRERARAQQVDLREFTQRTANLVTPALREKQLDFEIDLPPGGVAVETDPEKVRQALLDVLFNAVKFTRTGKVRLSARLEGGYVRFQVSDTGIGIRDADLPRIFDPFWQAEEPMTRREGGAGIGLSVARRLLHLLGGDIEVASTPGKGSVFTIRVPARSAGSGGSAAA